MNALDVVTIVAAAAAAAAAWRLGFVARALSWIGMALGLYGAARLVPPLLDGLDGASEVQAFFIVAATLIGGGVVGQALGLLIGGRLRVAIPEGSARRADQSFGAVAGALGVLVVLWLLLPMMASVPGLAGRVGPQLHRGPSRHRGPASAARHLRHPRPGGR